jgi:hypothetical protein
MFVAFTVSRTHKISFHNPLICHRTCAACGQIPSISLHTKLSIPKEQKKNELKTFENYQKFKISHKNFKFPIYSFFVLIQYCSTAAAATSV